VSSSGTARQIEKESDVLPVGGGVMWMEMVVAIIALLLSLLVIWTGVSQTIWVLFGGANQMMASLADEDGQIGARHLAASYYNLGLACRRSGREAEAIRRFNEAVDAWPESIYGCAATTELTRGPGRSDPKPEARSSRWMRGSLHQVSAEGLALGTGARAG